MAQRVKTFYVSDLSGEDLGSEGQPIKFGWLGVDYEIDLSQAEADEFAEVMDKYLKVARRIGGRRQTGARQSTGGRNDLNKIREWARANGHKVSDRGRIAQKVIDAYDASN